MSRKKFVNSQLVWVTSRKDAWIGGRTTCSRGYPEPVALEPGEAVMIIRRALAKDYGSFGRHTHNGISMARRLASTAWLVWYKGSPILVDEEWLCKRLYKPRKKQQQV